MLLDKKKYEMGVCILGHGSRESRGNNDFISFVKKFQEANKNYFVNYSFLEIFDVQSFSSPQDSISECVLHASTVIIAPLLLFEAGHVKKDVLKIIEEARLLHPRTFFLQAPVIGVHSKMVELIFKNFFLFSEFHFFQNSSFEKKKYSINSRSIHEKRITKIILLGRGFIDKEALLDFNTMTSKLRDLIKNSLKKKSEDFIEEFEVCFSGLQMPDLKQVLERLFKDNSKNNVKGKEKESNEGGASYENLNFAFGRVLVLPYLLFHGVLIEKAKKTLEEFSKIYTQIEFALAEPLATDAILLEVFQERIENCKQR